MTCGCEKGSYGSLDKVAISDDPGNGIQQRPDGLYVPRVIKHLVDVESDSDGIGVNKTKIDDTDRFGVEIFVSEDANNILEQRENGLFVPETIIPEVSLPTVVGSTSIQVSETELEYSVGVILSSGSGNQLTIEADGLFVPEVEIPETQISAEAGNLASLKSDGIYAGMESFGNLNAAPDTDYVNFPFDDPNKVFRLNAAVDRLILNMGTTLSGSEFVFYKNNSDFTVEVGSGVTINGVTGPIEIEIKKAPDSIRFKNLNGTDNWVAFYTAPLVLPDYLTTAALEMPTGFVVTGSPINSVNHTFTVTMDSGWHLLSQAEKDKLTGLGDAPVTSVNAKVGAVVLDHTDVGAEPVRTLVSDPDAIAGTSTDVYSWSPAKVALAVGSAVGDAVDSLPLNRYLGAHTIAVSAGTSIELLNIGDVGLIRGDFFWVQQGMLGPGEPGLADPMRVRFSTNNGSSYGSWQSLSSGWPSGEAYTFIAMIDLENKQIDFIIPGAAIYGVGIHNLAITVPSGTNAMQIAASSSNTGCSAVLTAMRGYSA